MKTAEYVVVGGGIMGMSTAYNLAKKGAKNVVLLEQKYIGYGSSGRNGSGIRQQYGRPERVVMGREAVKLWCGLAEELGHDCGFVQSGYAYALYDEDWIDRYKGFAAMHRSLDVPTQVISAQELKEIVPLFNTDGVIAATYCPTDGKADPFGTLCAYMIGGRRLGVEYMQYTQLLGAKLLPGGDWLLETSKGQITAANLIVTSGSWSCLIGDMVGEKIPVVPYVEEVMVTEPVEPGSIKPLLNLKSPKYNDFWLTQTTVNGGVIFGWGHAQFATDDRPTYDMTTSQAYAQIDAWNLVRAFPSFANVNIVRHFSGFYDVTPDREPIISRIGPNRFYAGLGCSFMHGPIGGQALAELILDGKMTCVDQEFCSVERFKHPVEIVAY